MEGQDPSAVKEIWERLAATEMRLQMMSDLIKLKVGLADIEEFNLTLSDNLKNKPSDKVTEMQNARLVKATMSVKLKDEQTTRSKLLRERNLARTKLMKELGRNSKRYRSRIRELRQAAASVKVEYRNIYTEKMHNLKLKYRDT